METGNTGFVVKANPSFVARGSINICRMNEWDYPDLPLQAMFFSLSFQGMVMTKY